MSSKVAISVVHEVRKNLAVTDTQRHTARKSDFKLKKLTGKPGPFGTAALCADPGTVFCAGDYRD